MENNWLDRGEGGEWYEPHVTNKDLLAILGITLFGSVLIIALLLSNFTQCIE